MRSLQKHQKKIVHIGMGEEDSMKDIIVGTKERRVFFHVNRDKREYYDLESIIISHPELTDYIEKNRIELNMELFRHQEDFNY